MFKLLIVEDELPVRNMIIESVDWQEIGFEVCFAAGDGQEALEYLEENQMDLILTDIYMPFIDGLELVRRIRKTNSYSKIVFLTGYNEFDYAKEAIELDASRYLLKPITKEELTKVLVEIKNELVSEIQAKKNLSHLEKEYEKRSEYLKDKLLYDIMAGYIPADRILPACDNLNCDFTSSFYRVGIIEVINKEAIGQKVWEDDYSLLHFAMYNISKEIIKVGDKTKVLLGDNGKIIIVFRSEDKASFSQVTSDYLNEVIHTMFHIYRMTLTAGLSDIYEDLYNLKYAYKEALIATSYSVIEGTNRVIVKSDLEPVSNMNHDKLDDYIESIISGIKMSQFDVIERYLALYFDLIRFEKYGLNEIKTVVLSLVTKVYDIYNQMCMKDELKESLDFSLIQEIFDLEDLEKLEINIKHVFVILGKKLIQSREDDRYYLVVQAVQHIESDYSNPSLDLNQMNEALHVSISYFSRIFKQVKGVTFLEYLTNYRMEKAKELLKTTNLKVYEVAENVGYDDAHYFSYNFRKNIGMTPLKFRKS